MWKWIKRGLWGLGGLVAIAAVAAFIYREPVERVYRVITLFSADVIVSNFSNMRSMFLPGQSTLWHWQPKRIISATRYTTLSMCGVVFGPSMCTDQIPVAC